MKIYKIAYRNKYDVISNRIGKIVFNSVIHNRFLNIEINFGKLPLDIQTEFKNININSFNINVEYNKNNTLSISPFSVGGEAVFIGDKNLIFYVNLDAIIYKNLFDFSNPHHVNHFYYRIVGVIKHELEHCNFIRINGPVEKKRNSFYGLDLIGRINEAKQYFNKETEKNSFMLGAVLEAKKIRKNNKDINIFNLVVALLNETIDNAILGYDIFIRKMSLREIEQNSDIKGLFISTKNEIIENISRNVIIRFPEIGKRKNDISRNN